MENEIIVVKQLPVIIERLAQIKEEVTAKVEVAKSLVCTEETVKEVKKARAELGKEYKAWEEKRKEVKSVVMSPYEQFEAVYKDCITNTYKTADNELKRKIDSVESELKEKKEQKVIDYFNEYLLSKGIDFVSFEDARINITLTASMKSLKDQAKEFIDKITDDLALIETQEHKAEILVEYKRSLNVSQAITSVTARLRAIEEEKKRQEEAAAKKAAEEQRLAEIRVKEEETSVTLTPPTLEPQEEPQVEVPEIVEEVEEEFCLNFKVTATMAKLKELKAFLNERGYKYE